jgi:hypothetical protein
MRSDTGELWAWVHNVHDVDLSKPFKWLPGVKVNAVVAYGSRQLLAVADDGRVYAWGCAITTRCAGSGSGSGSR